MFYFYVGYTGDYVCSFDESFHDNEQGFCRKKNPGSWLLSTGAGIYTPDLVGFPGPANDNTFNKSELFSFFYIIFFFKYLL